MLFYCPFCGHTKTMNYRHGDELMCKACGAHFAPGQRAHTRLKLETARVITAAVWMSGRVGMFTRSELAGHLGVANSPYFRQVLAGLADRGILAVFVGLHEQNGRPTLFYTRASVAASRSRQEVAQPVAAAQPVAVASFSQSQTMVS